MEPGRADTPLPALEARYEILGEAGRGGMGVVYKARDRETNEYVALKVLKPEIANESTIIERFKDELKLARKVTHKNVCRIHEFNRTADGSAYISMEFVEGDSLRRVLARFGQFALRKGIQIAQQICAGLGEAHAQGVVHRDLKPENIILDQAGNVKIMDFGIARSLETATTRSSGILGTPAYMSPEQAAGKKVDRRADIYSLGLILYEVFTGSMAFSGETPVEMALKQIHETPSAPRAVEPTVPAYIEKAILKCLEKNPDKRFQSVEQLEAALTRQPEEKPVAAEGAEVTMPARLAFWQRSDWYLLGSAVLGMILFFPLFYRFHPASALEITVTAEQARQIANDALKKLGWDAEAQKPDLQFSPVFFDFDASPLGYSSLPGKLRSPLISTGAWSGGLKFRQGEYRGGGYGIDPKGRLFRIYRRLAGISPQKQLELAPDATTKELGRNALKSLYGQEAAVGEPDWRPEYVGESLLIWRSAPGTKGYGETFTAAVQGANVTRLGRKCKLPGTLEEYNPFQAVLLSLRAGLIPPLFALVLFLLRKLYLQPRSLPNLWLGAVVASGLAVTSTSFVPRPTEPVEWFLLCAVVLVVFCIGLPLCYAVLNTVLYYSRGGFPAQVASYLLLFRERAVARGAGLALLRGIFAGLGFSGCWMAVVSLAGPHGQALPGLTTWLCFFYGWGEERILVPRHFPVLFIGEVVLVGWLLVAFPLSLLGRVSGRWRILLPALAALWLAFGFSLAGGMVLPRLSYYILVVVQAVFFGALFLRYDLLTTLSAVFTIEVCLLAFPFLVVFQQIDPVPYLIPVGLWALLLLAAAGLYFRPQLVASYRRVAAVFE
jgi:tRNA A-37 threonylcarbamoyl transferase component Bud32